MNFTFSNTAGASQSTSKPRLEGNKIHEVKFVGAEIQDIEGVKNPGTIYKVIKLKFENEEGVFEHTVFEPRDSDFERRANTFMRNGVEESIPQPSNVESMMLLFKHVIDSVNPAIAKEIDDGTKNLGAKTWDDLRKLVAKILDVGKGTVVKIKLLKNKKGEAIFPGYFTGLSKPDPVTNESKVYMRNNFVGKNLAFSTYEAQRINNESNATPTKIDPFKEDLGMPEAPGNDLAFDVLDL